jgi:diguanylate cyclase (GGDEF)-like protein
MPTSTETLLFGAATLALAALALTGFGLRQRRYPGFGFWVAGLWITTAGALVGAVFGRPRPPGRAEMLMMQWPIFGAGGLAALPAAATDAGPGICRLGGAGWHADADVRFADRWARPCRMAARCLMACVHLYAATLLFMAPGGSENTPAQGLGAVMAITALGRLLCTLPGAELLSPMVACLASATLGSVALAFAAVTLVSERNERQLRDSRRRLRVLANLDPLTQVPNRRRFQELADDALRHDTPGSAVLLMFDVDHFKQINDSLGHAAGDRALCLVCGSVLEHLRTQDVPGRHGGDEFVLLLRETNTRDAMSVAARIVTDVQRRAPGHDLPQLSLSFGLVQVGMVEDIRMALRRADQALYEAKRQGRSRAVTAQGDEKRAPSSARASAWGCSRPDPARSPPPAGHSAGPVTGRLPVRPDKGRCA